MNHDVLSRRLQAFPTGDGLRLAAQPEDSGEALQRLITGNERFVAGESTHGRMSEEWRKELVGGQRSFAVALGCSDSCVIPELIFDQDLGDLFVIRIAGNVIADVAGSLHYAGRQLHVRLPVVLGHEGRGVEQAAGEDHGVLARAIVGGRGRGVAVWSPGASGAGSAHSDLHLATGPLSGGMRNADSLGFLVHESHRE